MDEATPGQSSAQAAGGGGAEAGPSGLLEPVPQAAAARPVSRISPHRQRASVLTEEVLERQNEICRQLGLINKALLSINDTK